MWELENDPDQSVLQILDLRAYEQAFRAYDACDSEEDLQKLIAGNPMVEMVVQIDHELAAATLERLKARAIERALAEDV